MSNQIKLKCGCMKELKSPDDGHNDFRLKNANITTCGECMQKRIEKRLGKK